jgi:hypothetical protein
MTEPTLYVRQADSGSPWSTPETSAYSSESELQALLAADPTQVPGVEEGAVAVRELPTEAGPIDVCVVSRDGTVTVVECKLSKNSEPRRMVIGQVIDYASALRSGGVRTFRESWSGRGGADLDDMLDPSAVEALERNIGDGRIDLCLAVDRIDDDFRRLVEYLNLVTRDEVMVTALQLTYVRHGSLEILIPSTFGTEIARVKAPRRAKGIDWTWEDFVDSLSDQSDKLLAAELSRRLHATPSTGRYPKMWFGKNPQGGIFFHIHGERYAPFQVWRNSAGQLRLFGNWRVWGAIANDVRFAELAEVMGQDHQGGASSVIAASLDLDKFWAVATECDAAINGRP